MAASLLVAATDGQYRLPAMQLALVYHPRELVGRDLSNVCCVVLDLLRATTTMTAAIAHGAKAIHVFGELDEARSVHAVDTGKKLLAGERGCLPPAGFDVGNSPGDFTRDRVEGATVFMSTTNGTRAVHACRGSKRTLVAALVNAKVTARALRELDRDVLFVCAGVDGVPGGEDIDAAATIADAMLRSDARITCSAALTRDIAQCSWISNAFSHDRLLAAPGGQNLRKAGLERDIAFAARLDCFDCVCEVIYAGSDAVVRRSV